MKKKLLIMSLWLSLGLVCSCGKSGEQASEEQPVYHIPTSREETVQTSMESSVESGIGDGESVEGTKDDTSDVEVFEGEAFFADFEGVGAYETTAANTSDFRNAIMSSIVCKDEQGTIYYVNYGTYEDNYIYAYKDGVSSLLVDKICNFINFYEDSLYFLVSETPPDWLAFSWAGKLYRYDLASGETELVLDENVCNLYVADGRMYFCDELRVGSDEKVYGGDWHSMKIGDARPERMGRLLPFFYGDYQLAYSEEEKIGCLVLTDGEEDIPITRESYLGNNHYTIIGDTLWLSARTEEGTAAVAAVNLADGTHKWYPATAYTPSGGMMVTNIGLDYAIIDNRIYAVSQSGILAYDENQGCFDKFVFDSTAYTGLYTDGESLYGLACYGIPFEYHTNGIVKITPNPEDGQIGQITLDSEYREVISEGGK
ncbi:MAG: DUF5050 domain-containing protein [Roseburia sp.]|nr:DUF5050 domain-containing protein [Roseburia sp.]